MINVTKSFAPPIEEYLKYVSEIYERNWFTNQGPCVQELETQLKEYLGTPQLNFVGNGTIALQLALRTLNLLAGEIITTPFSYVATVSSILWERCKPVFVDIEPNTFCIDADQIEAAITPQTKGIMGVHVYGYPCNISTIAAISRKYTPRKFGDCTTTAQTSDPSAAASSASSIRPSAPQPTSGSMCHSRATGTSTG
ncbi:MAG: DegT/DnrJ/EryC1/StrS aminotransferase family protein [Oscillochloris sp.]|nr:DegT/DnrJ/EryC1/StrS aminotransferase family protein [Oscillochloris sp.]